MSLPATFLHRKINFVVLMAVVATTVFSWYNQNSWCIILLVLCRLVDGGPVRALRYAFTNKFFLAFLAFVVIDAVGFLFTHNKVAGGRVLTKEVTLVAISLVLCGGPFADAKEYRQMMTGYCAILLAACVYCLIIAWNRYRTVPDVSVFFYHSLTNVIGENAVFFSVYMIFGLLFLLSHPIEIGPVPGRLRKYVQLVVIIFFTGFIVLLSSKLLLVVLLLLLVHFVLQRYIFLKSYVTIAMIGLVGSLAILWLTISDNPVKARYLDLEQGDIRMVNQQTFADSTKFNGAQIRLLQWKYANEIMNEHNAWLLGVTSGNSQDLLNEKYRQAHMFMGIENTRQRGYTDYNFHNQYIETAVRIGFLGFAVLLYICWLMIELAVTRRTVEVLFTVLTLLSISTTQSLLTLQHGVFAFAFMPLVLLYSPKQARARQTRTGIAGGARQGLLDGA